MRSGSYLNNLAARAGKPAIAPMPSLFRNDFFEAASIPAPTIVARGADRPAEPPLAAVEDPVLAATTEIAQSELPMPRRLPLETQQRAAEADAPPKQTRVSEAVELEPPHTRQTRHTPVATAEPPVPQAVLPSQRPPLTLPEPGEAVAPRAVVASAQPQAISLAKHRATPGEAAPFGLPVRSWMPLVSGPQTEAGRVTAPLGQIRAVPTSVADPPAREHPAATATLKEATRFTVAPSERPPSPPMPPTPKQPPASRRGSGGVTIGRLDVRVTPPSPPTPAAIQPPRRAAPSSPSARLARAFPAFGLSQG
jgi:hypothetical protein